MHPQDDLAEFGISLANAMRGRRDYWSLDDASLRDGEDDGCSRAEEK
jgi:hypothetical protein